VPFVVAFMFVGEAALLIAYIVAWACARLHYGKRHHYVMLSSFALDMLVFKPIMISRAFRVYGSYPWPGSSIALHFWLDAAVAVLGLLTIYFAFRFRTVRDRKMFMPPKGRVHRRLGIAFIILWIATFIVGVRVFAWAHLP